MSNILNDKENLFNKVRAVINQNRKDNKLMADICEALKIRVSTLKIIALFRGDFVELNTSELYHLTNAIMKYCDKDDYKPHFKLDDYFTLAEKNEAELYHIEQKEFEKEIIKIPRVHKISDEEFMVIDITYAELDKLMDKIIYIPKAQREPKMIDTGIGMVEIPTIFPKSIDEMSDLMCERKFFDNVITVNILQTGEEEFDYDGINLIIEKGIVHCIDGWNRKLAIRKTMNRKPEVGNQKMQLKIYNFTLEKANEYILQETKGNDFSIERKTSLMNDNYNKVSNYLNTDSGSLLIDKISLVEEAVYKYNSAYVMNSTIVEALSKTFVKELGNTISQSNLNKTMRKIKERFNLILDYFSEDFKDVKISQNKGRVFTYNNMFIFYVLLIEKFKDEPKWEEKMEYVLMNIDENGDLLSFNYKKRRLVDKRLFNDIKKDFENTIKKIFEEVA